MGRIRWRGRDRVLAVALDAWPLLLAVLLVLPLLTRTGLPLARDLVFVPHLTWNDARLGLGDGAPRAVPLDAVVSLVGFVVPGGVLARLLLPVVLAAAGWGVHRLLPDAGAAARLAAGGVAVWNPYTVERLTLGQWALLAAYAALPWLVGAAVRFRAEGRRRDLASVVLWAALASLTPTGGLLALATVLAMTLGRALRPLAAPALVAVLQLPWVLPGLLGVGGLTSDPAGVDAFAARGEGHGGPWVALAGLGGIWDSRSMPASRGTWLTVVAALVSVGLVLGAVVLSRRAGGSARGSRLPGGGRLLGLAAGGLVVAGLSTVPAGAETLRWLVEEVPGAGLLRDTQKYLAPYALLVSLAAGLVSAVALRGVTRLGAEARLSVALVLVVLPLLLLPDATVSTWRTVDPVDYPADVVAVYDLLEEQDDPGALLTLPWRSYRNFSWGHGEVSSDPAVRWLRRPVVTADDLAVGSVVVRGESALAASVGEALETGTPAEAMRTEGLHWALVYEDDPGAGEVDRTGLVEVLRGEHASLYAADTDVVVSRRRPGALAPVLVADLVALALVLAAAAVRTTRRKDSAWPG